MAVPLLTKGIHAGTFCYPGLAVMDEDVVTRVRIPGHEVRRKRIKGHVSTIGRD